MPELPEVEATRQNLLLPLPGARILNARVGKPLRWPLGMAVTSLTQRVLGAPIRRAKYLWLPLYGDATPATDPAPAGGLLIHLGMSGSLQWWPDSTPAPAAGRHIHFEMLTDRGTLRLNDPRRFGAVVWSASLCVDPAAKLLAKLGVEPFSPDFNGTYLHHQCVHRRAPIKSLLLSGTVVVGAGNIYACEALFRAGIDPRTAAHRLSRHRCQRLATTLRAVLSEALTMGGSSLRDFRNAHGQDGQFQTIAQVYGRAGEPCLRCKQPVQRMVQAQRATYFCPHCQRP